MNGEGGDNIRKFPTPQGALSPEELSQRQLENLFAELDTRAKTMYESLKEIAEKDPALDTKRKSLAEQAKDTPPKEFKDWLQTRRSAWEENPPSFFLIAELYLKKRGLLKDPIGQE